MPSAHRIALTKLLETVNHRIAQREGALLNPKDDDERLRLIEELAGLAVRKDDLIEALSGDGGLQ